MLKKTALFPLVEDLLRFHFSEELQSGYLAYKNDCRNYFSDEHNMHELIELKKQLLEASKTPSFNWKKVSYDNVFFRYDSRKTEEELFLDLKVLCWDFFFPEDVLNPQEKKVLKARIYKLCVQQIEERLSFSELLEALNIDDRGVFNKDIGKLDLITLFYDPVLFKEREIIWGFYRGGTPSWTLYAEIETHHLKLDHSLGTQEWVVSTSEHIS